MSRRGQRRGLKSPTAWFDKSKQTTELGKQIGVVTRSESPDIKAGDPVHEVTRLQDVRAVAVDFYLSLLGSSVSKGVRMQASTNRAGASYPENIDTVSIIDAAVEQIAEHMVTSRKGPLTTSERKHVYNMLVQYLAVTFYTKLREARIFQFKERDYIAMHHLADVNTVMGAGFKWTPAHTVEDIPLHETAQVCQYMVDEGVKVPFPEKLPFHSCYFAWGTGVKPGPVMTRQYGLDKSRFNLIMGTLLSDDGWVFTVLLSGTDKIAFGMTQGGSVAAASGPPLIILERIGDSKVHKEDHKHVSSGDQRIDTLGEEFESAHDNYFQPGWMLPFALTPWVVAYAVQSIDANDSLTKVGAALLRERLQYKAVSKRTKQQFLPKPYYTVVIQPTTYEEIEKTIRSQPRNWSHRWDVRGHYGHRIVRGTLPIDPKLVYQLHKRGYEIFHALHRPSSEALAFLMRRRIMPPKSGEWLAYLRFHREAFIKGPANKPYVPSVHRLRGGVPEII